MRVLLGAEYDALHQERVDRGEVTRSVNGFEFSEISHGGLSQGYFQCLDLRPELWIEIHDEHQHIPLSLKTSHGEDMPLIAKFYLKGHHRVTTPHAREIPAEYEEVEGQSYLLFLPDLQEVEHLPAGDLHLIRVCLDVGELQRSPLASESLPLPLRQLLEGQAPRFHQALGQFTAAMKLAIAQMLNCPYQGLTKRLFLEAKALELFALQFEQWSETTAPEAPQPLSTGDLERLHQARQVIQHNLDNPPSLLELARQVGLNDYKLKRGFRQLFNTTVFGYVQTCRMERAQHLLLEHPHLTIAGVAQSVGYASQSRFCHAFKRRFGASPQTYRRAQRS